MNHGLKTLAQELPRHGRYGDSIVAHINPAEAALLKSLGGSGTINQTTGLPEFWGGLGALNPFNPGSAAGKAVGSIPGVSQLQKAATDVFQPLEKAVVQPASNALVGLDKSVGKMVPGGWGTLGMVAASMIPGMTPLMMAGLGAINGSGILRPGSSLGRANLQGALMGGAMAYGMANLATGLEAAGGGGESAMASLPGSEATAEQIAGQMANQTGSAVSAAPGSQAAMLAEQATGMGSAGAQNISSALTAPTTGTGIGSQIMAGNFGNAATQLGQNISNAATGAYDSIANFADKATTGSTYSDFGKDYAKNVSDTGKGIGNLFSGDKAAAAAYSGTGATLSNTAVPIIAGGMGLADVEAQRNYLKDQLAAGNIAQQEYDSQLAEINRQADIARRAVASSPFSTTPSRDVSIGETFYGRSGKGDTLYGKAQDQNLRQYAVGGPVDDESGMDEARGLDQGNMYNGFMGGGIAGYSKGGQAKERSELSDMIDASFRSPPAQYVEGMGFVTPPPSVEGRLGANFDALGGNIRAGASGMAMMTPDKRIMANPGMFDIGYKGRVGPGNLDVGLQRAIKGAPGRGKDYAFNANYEIPFAEGGQARFLSGGGDGMSDSIPANIEGKQEARLADGEFVIPADVVSHLGNGSSKAGAKQLYSMMDKIRQARTGNKKQGKEINPTKFMPA